MGPEPNNPNGGANAAFGQSKAKMQEDNNSPVLFKDVAGCDEAVEEVREVVDFLRDPEKFQKLGARIPRGLLLVGPPGTGKTLLAKAMAGEAKVPFFSISGSDFVEMFVGVGAARMRDMFAKGKSHKACIIFIDEIDAIGRQRGASSGGANDEREQTLNQMLVEMDGFEPNSGTIIVAATNRPDILDAALLRPGRFDRQIYVTPPDIVGRLQILNVHAQAKKVPLDASVELSVIARGTPGMTGADLANLLNEAALGAAHRSGASVSMHDLSKAKDKILMGPERKSLTMPDKDRWNTAYHEAGHTLVGKLLPKCDPVHKVSIIPRGRALGVTLSLPRQDRYAWSKDEMNANIAMLYGGRIGEEIFGGEGNVTTGAANDIERASHLARDMVTRHGFSKDLGPILYAATDKHASTGRTVSYSEFFMRTIDKEVREIVREANKVARALIVDNVSKLHEMAACLHEFETLNEIDLDEIVLEGKDIRGRKRREQQEALQQVVESTAIILPLSDVKVFDYFTGRMAPG